MKYDVSKLYRLVSNDPRCSTAWNINSCCFILLYSINDLQYKLTSCLASYGMKTHRNYSQQENCFYAKLTCWWERSDSFANSLPQFVFCSNKTDSFFTFYNCWHFIVLTPGLGRSTYFPARSSQIEGSRHVKPKKYLPSFERSEPTPICTNVRTQLNQQNGSSSQNAWLEHNKHSQGRNFLGRWDGNHFRNDKYCIFRRESADRKMLDRSGEKGVAGASFRGWWGGVFADDLVLN